MRLPGSLLHLREITFGAAAIGAIFAVVVPGIADAGVAAPPSVFVASPEILSMIPATIHPRDSVEIEGTRLCSEPIVRFGTIDVVPSIVGLRRIVVSAPERTEGGTWSRDDVCLDCGGRRCLPIPKDAVVCDRIRPRNFDSSFGSGTTSYVTISGEHLESVTEVEVTSWQWPGVHPAELIHVEPSWILSRVAIPWPDGESIGGVTLVGCGGVFSFTGLSEPCSNVPFVFAVAPTPEEESRLVRLVAYGLGFRSLRGAEVCHPEGADCIELEATTLSTTQVEFAPAAVPCGKLLARIRFDCGYEATLPFELSCNGEAARSDRWPEEPDQSSGGSPERDRSRPGRSR